MKREMVAALIIKGGRLLLEHNIKHSPVRIEPPGGKVEPGESREEALVREIKEEIGVSLSVGKLLGSFDTISPEGPFTVYMYFCDIVEGNLQILEPEKISKIGWYTYEEIEKFAEQSLLVPNLIAALPQLKAYLTNP